MDTYQDVSSLERICVILPLPSNFYLDFDAFVYILGSALIVNPQLQQIPILELVRSGLVVCRRQTNVVEEGATARLGVTD